MKGTNYVLKLKGIPHIKEHLDCMYTNAFIPTKKNFVEFSLDDYYLMFNTIVGIQKHYFVLPEVTEDWSVKEVIEHCEKRCRKSKNDTNRIRYVVEEEKDLMLEIADSIREICKEKSFNSPTEILDFVQKLIDE